MIWNIAAINELVKPENYMAISEVIAKNDGIPIQIEQMLGKEYIEDMRDKAEGIISGKINNELNSQNNDSLPLLQLALLIHTLPTILQQQSTVACFSEDVNSILMWSHYADYHKGFVLGYDLREMLLPNPNGLGLFPVVYDNKRFDATSYLCYCLGFSMGLPMRNIDMMGHFKLLLYKAMEWAYELEWRLINAQPANKLGGRSEPVVIIPNSIYYGCKISEENFEKLHEIAKLKGLEEYKMKENFKFRKLK